jgi:hypothetical protein
LFWFFESFVKVSLMKIFFKKLIVLTVLGMKH